MELQTGAARHVYTLKVFQRAFSIFFAILCIGLCIVFFFNARESDRVAAFVFGIMGVLSALGAVFMFAHAVRARLALEGSRITIRGPFSERSADLRDIEGFRTIHTRNGSFQQLILRDNQGKITISSGFATDDDFRAWMQNVADLDERDRQAALAAIQQDSELGSTPEERLSALSRAKRTNITLLIVSIAIAIALNFGPASLHKPAAILLAFAPALVFYLASSSPLLYAVLKRKADPRTDLGGILIAAAFGLFFQFVRYHFVSMGSIAAYALPLAVLATGVFLPIVKRGAASSLFGLVFALIFFAGFYSFGLVGAADALFDSSPGTPYVVPIVEKHVTHGKSTSYHLTLAPWGPLRQTNDLTVSHGEYDERQPGDAVCLDLHPGSLHVSWYTQSSCPAGSQ